jgi:hypothetical protein
VQNFYFQLLAQKYPREKARARTDETARLWIACFHDLGRMLRVKVPE